MKPILNETRHRPLDLSAVSGRVVLVYNETSGIWTVLDLGNRRIEADASDVTHWLELAHLEPDDIEAREEMMQDYWNEQAGLEGAALAP